MYFLLFGLCCRRFWRFYRFWRICRFWAQQLIRDNKGNDGEPPADGIHGSDEASDDDSPPVEASQFTHGALRKHRETLREHRRRQESVLEDSSLTRELVWVRFGLMGTSGISVEALWERTKEKKPRKTAQLAGDSPKDTWESPGSLVLRPSDWKTKP